jgi:hypothetical protein
MDAIRSRRHPETTARQGTQLLVSEALLHPEPDKPRPGKPMSSLPPACAQVLAAPDAHAEGIMVDRGMAPLKSPESFHAPLARYVVSGRLASHRQPS